MEKKIGKKEIILLIILFAALFVIWFCYHQIHRESGNRIRVTVAGETLGEYDLSTDREIPIESGGSVTNTLIISEGKADMISADCPDQICVNAQPVSKKNESIVCLPNQIVVEVISSDEEPEFDVIVQ
ncbi:MAG: NusG domain II-containing protein [Lachnospiraceae bacterium]|nr:NusG domain II-containing protein [Lachnospiraceae bacterium]